MGVALTVNIKAVEGRIISTATTEFRNCVKVEVAVLTSLLVSVDVKIY